MKKLILIASAAMLSVGATNAQIGIAPEVGVNLAKFNGKDAGESKFKPGLKAGVNFNIPIANNLYLQPGVFYNMKGSKYEDTYLNTTYTNDVTLNYIEVPVNILYRYPVGVGHLLINAGPSFAYGMGGKSKIDPAPPIGNAETKLKFSKDEGDYKPFDIGFNVGAGYELPMGLFVRAQYGMGFGSIRNDYKDWAGNTVTSDSKNSVIQLSLGYNLWTWNR